MEYFLSCDWGTSSFRLRLIHIGHEKVVSEQLSGEGISDTFNLWKQTADADKKRVSFYLNIVNGHIKKLEQRLSSSLDGVKIIISGMASSSAGFIDIPYSGVPLPVDGSGIKTAAINANKEFDHDCLIISGVKTGGDVMRGEETQVIGCIDPKGRPIKNELFILPGTHCKHVRVQNDQITGFKTFMTGEFFELLSKKSILKNSIELIDAPEGGNLRTFKGGIRDAITGNLLHSAFNVRINHLFNKFTKAQNFTYLNGLLIGTELKDLAAEHSAAINLICSAPLAQWYGEAMKELRINYSFSPGLAGEATVRGHLKIGRQLKFIA